MKMRCVPVLINHYKENDIPPPLFSLGFAAYLYFMKAVSQKDKAFYGEFDGQPYLIEDEKASKFYNLWNNKSIDVLVKEVLKDKDLWDHDLTQLAGFQQSVTDNLQSIIDKGAKITLEKNGQAIRARLAV